METPIRSIIKAAIWNVIGLTMMTLVGYVATGSLSTGGVMAVINTVIGFVCYLFYERIWARIGWGRHEGRHV